MRESQSLWARRAFGEYSGQWAPGVAIILKVFLTWALSIPLRIGSSLSPEIITLLTVWICLGQGLTLSEICFRKHMVTQPVEWQTRDQARFPDSHPSAFLATLWGLGSKNRPQLSERRGFTEITCTSWEQGKLLRLAVWPGEVTNMWEKNPLVWQQKISK